MVLQSFGLDLSRILRIRILKLVRCYPAPPEHFSRQNLFDLKLGTYLNQPLAALFSLRTLGRNEELERERGKERKEGKKENEWFLGCPVDKAEKGTSKATQIAPKYPV